MFLVVVKWETEYFTHTNPRRFYLFTSLERTGSTTSKLTEVSQLQGIIVYTTDCASYSRPLGKDDLDYFGGIIPLFSSCGRGQSENHWSSEERCGVLRSWQFPCSQSILLGRVSPRASHPPLTAVCMSEQVTDRLELRQHLRSFCSNQGEKCLWPELEMEINEWFLAFQWDQRLIIFLEKFL